MTTPADHLKKGYLVSAVNANSALKLGHPAPEPHIADELDLVGSRVVLSPAFVRGHLVQLLGCHDLEAKWLVEHYDGSEPFSLFVYDITRIITKVRRVLITKYGPPEERDGRVIWHTQRGDVQWTLEQQIDRMVEIGRRLSQKVGAR